MNHGYGRWYVVGGRWGRAGFRSQNEEHLLSADRLLLSAYCLLPAALRGVRAGGTLVPYSSLGQNVFSTGKEETVVTLKLKDRRGNVYENKG